MKPGIKRKTSIRETTTTSEKTKDMFGSKSHGFIFFIIISTVLAMLDLEELQKALNPEYEGANNIFKRKFFHGLTVNFHQGSEDVHNRTGNTFHGLKTYCLLKS